jgi:myo-inositol-1(or 4)-monophosphatase
MKHHARAPKRIHAETQHDIKLELDVRCQELIQRCLRREYPGCAILGEEGVLGDTEAEHRWVVDPIDGTVNFTYGIPHACVSIALQHRTAGTPRVRREATPDAAYTTVLGVVYDPFSNELWTAVRGGPARLDGRPVQVSRRARLREAIVTVGFSKDRVTLETMLPLFNQLVHRVRKVRIMGSAALALAYVAAGRMDAYVEQGVRLWDIAAGGLMVECAGGEFWHQAVDAHHTYRIIANNGLLRRQMQRLCC